MIRNFRKRLDQFESNYDSSRRAHPLIEEILALYLYRELIYQFISRSIKTRYKRSFLGILWTLLNPLLTMIVLTIVFSSLLKFAIDFYPIYLLSGLICWNFFSSATRAAIGEMIFNGVLFNRIYVPKSVFAIAALGTELINFGISLIPLFLISIFLGVTITPAIVVLPLSIFLLLLFSLGFGLLLATVGVYFADMLPVYDVMLMVWMYATPIMYPLEILPPAWANIFRYNPMYYFIQTFRQPLLEGVFPSAEVWTITALIAVLTFILGGLVFTSRSNEYAYRL